MKTGFCQAVLLSNKARFWIFRCLYFLSGVKIVPFTFNISLRYKQIFYIKRIYVCSLVSFILSRCLDKKTFWMQVVRTFFTLFMKAMLPQLVSVKIWLLQCSQNVLLTHSLMYLCVCFVNILHILFYVAFFFLVNLCFIIRSLKVSWNFMYLIVVYFQMQ